MKHYIAVIGAIAGLASVARGQGLVELQVSPHLSETWTNSINALPGDSIDVRVRLSYTGTAAPLGLGSMEFQPTLSNWDASGVNQDTFTPLFNGGTGGGRTTPLGEVLNSSGQYGRIIPYGYRFDSATAPVTGIVNVVSSISYLRLARSINTSWIGDGQNVNGWNGIQLAQLNNTGRIPSDLPFSTRLQNLTVLKFNLVLSTDPLARTLTLDTPRAGYLDTQAIKWYANMTEALGSISGDPTVAPGTINVVPGPGVLALAATGVGLLLRRRRRA